MLEKTVYPNSLPFNHLTLWRKTNFLPPLLLPSLPPSLPPSLSLLLPPSLLSFLSSLKVFFNGMGRNSSLLIELMCYKWHFWCKASAKSSVVGWVIMFQSFSLARTQGLYLMVKAWGGLGESLILTFDAWCSLCSSESNNVATLISTLVIFSLVLGLSSRATLYSRHGCSHFLLPGHRGKMWMCVCVCVCVCVWRQLHSTHWDLMDCSPPGSSVQGIFLKRILEWVAISSSRGSSNPGIEATISHIFYICRQILYTEPPRNPMQTNNACPHNEWINVWWKWKNLINCKVLSHGNY